MLDKQTIYELNDLIHDRQLSIALCRWCKEDNRVFLPVADHRDKRLSLLEISGVQDVVVVDEAGIDTFTYMRLAHIDESRIVIEAHQALTIEILTESVAIRTIDILIDESVFTREKVAGLPIATRRSTNWSHIEELLIGQIQQFGACESLT